MPQEEASTFQFIWCSIWKPGDSYFWVKISSALEQLKMSFPPLFSGTSEAELLASGKAECLLAIGKDQKGNLFWVTCSFKKSVVCSLHFNWLVCCLHFTLSLHFTPRLQSVVHSLHFTLTGFQFQSKPVFSIRYYFNPFQYTALNTGQICQVQLESVTENSCYIWFSPNLGSEVIWLLDKTRWFI